MAQLGADPDELRGLARSLRSAAGQLDTLSIGLTRRARTSGWRGEDAESFDRRWRSSHRPALDAAAAGLLDMARRAERDAAEQQRASTTGAAVATAHASPYPLVTTLDATAPSSPTLPSLPALPRVEDRYQGNLELRLGPVATGIVGELTIAHLDGSRRRVVLSETVAGGAVLSAGSAVSVGVGGPHGSGATPSGGSAEARVRAGVVQRRSWEVDEDRVDDLLARLAVEHAGEAATGRSDPLVAAAAVADGLVEWVTGSDPGWDVAASVATAVPTPVGHEELVEVELAGSAGVGMGALAGLGGRAQGVESVRIGTAQRGADRATVLEVQSSATAALTSTILRRLGISLPPDVHRGIGVRLELPTGDGTELPSHVMVQLSSTSDTEVHDIVARVDLGGPSAGPTVQALAASLQALGRGDVASAVAQLGGVQIDPDQVTIAAETGTLSGHSARATATAGAGVGVGGGARGQALHIERR